MNSVNNILYKKNLTKENKKLVISKITTYSSKARTINITSRKGSFIYNKKKINENFKNPKRKDSSINNNNFVNNIFKKKCTSMDNSQSQNNSMIKNNYLDVTNNKKNNERKYKKYHINNSMEIKKKNIIIKNSINNSPWRTMSIDLNEFSLLKKKINYSFNIDNDDNIQKVILIQSFIRRFLLRKLLYKKLMIYYRSKNSAIKFNRILVKVVKNIFIDVIESIYLSRDNKYYLNKKEYELLVELHKRNIYSKNDWINYFNKLINGKLIKENKKIKNK